MRLSISEILEKCSKAPAKERAAVLQANDTLALRVILQYALDPRIVWELPLGVPPYKPSELLDQQGKLIQDIRMLQYFIKDSSPHKLHPLKRETMFIQFLESLDPKDAALICAAKDKKLPVKGISVKVVNEAFPGLVLEKEKEEK
jgi:hypothetical protein